MSTMFDKRRVYMKITLTSKPKAKPDFSKLGFGKYFTDHMLLMEYHDGAWGEPQIIQIGRAHV